MKANYAVIITAVMSCLVSGAFAQADDAASNAPNGAKATRVLENVGAAGGAVAGTLGGEAIGGAKGAAAGGVFGERLGGALGSSAGRVLDTHAAENQGTGRGGADDPRYNPSTLFSH